MKCNVPAALLSAIMLSTAACSGAPSKASLSGTWINTNQACMNTGIMKMNLTSDNYIQEQVRDAGILAMIPVRLKPTDMCLDIDKETMARQGTFTINAPHLVITCPNGWGQMAQQPPVYVKLDGNNLIMASDPDYKSDVEIFRRG